MLSRSLGKLAAVCLLLEPSQTVELTAQKRHHHRRHQLVQNADDDDESMNKFMNNYSDSENLKKSIDENNASSVEEVDESGNLA